MDSGINTDVVVDGEYEFFIANILDGVAYCDVVDDGRKSYLEVPVGNLEKVCNDCGDVKTGAIFKMDYCDGDFEFRLLKQSPMTGDEVKKVLEYYGEKYGDL